MTAIWAKPPPIELLNVCVVRRGVWRGALLADFVHSWAIAECEAGHKVGIEEYGRSWASVSRRTAYRRLSEFRATFPELGPDAVPGDMIVWRERATDELVAEVVPLVAA
jgi:hypothetical protein